MEPFFLHFPEISEKETRAVVLSAGQHGLPPDQYIFLEYYCMNPECDCRSVLLEVINSKGEHLASISHSLEKTGFWAAGGKQSFLDRHNKQGHYAKALLKFFIVHLMNADYARDIERHLLLMRKKIKKGCLPGFNIIGIKNALAAFFRRWC